MSHTVRPQDKGLTADEANSSKRGAIIKDRDVSVGGLAGGLGVEILPPARAPRAIGQVIEVCNWKVQGG